MDDFEKARMLFKEYEKNGAVESLEEALEKLDGAVKNQDPYSKKAINLKNTIGKYLNTWVRNICARCNLEDFSNNLKNIDDLISFLNGSLSKEDAMKFIKIISMQKKYFEGWHGVE